MEFRVLGDRARTHIIAIVGEKTHHVNNAWCLVELSVVPAVIQSVPQKGIVGGPTRGRHFFCNLPWTCRVGCSGLLQAAHAVGYGRACLILL